MATQKKGQCPWGANTALLRYRIRQPGLESLPRNDGLTRTNTQFNAIKAVAFGFCLLSPKTLLEARGHLQRRRATGAGAGARGRGPYCPPVTLFEATAAELKA